MQKKMMGLFVALVAFGAFALVPAISSAHGLTDTSGGVTTKVEASVNKKIVGYNETGSSVKFNAAGLVIECGETTLTGSVHANPDTKALPVLGTLEHVYFRGSEAETKCKSTLGAATITVPDLTQAGGTGATSHWCLKTIVGTNEFEVEGRNCTETVAKPTFTFLIHAGGTTCGYTREANLKGHFTTTAATHTPATLTLNANQELTKHVGGILCPATGKLEQFAFELFTDTDPSTPGTWRHAASVADPVWIAEGS